MEVFPKPHSFKGNGNFVTTTVLNGQIVNGKIDDDVGPKLSER